MTTGVISLSPLSIPVWFNALVLSWGKNKEIVVPFVTSGHALCTLWFMFLLCGWEKFLLDIGIYLTYSLQNFVF